MQCILGRLGSFQEFEGIMYKVRRSTRMHCIAFTIHNFRKVNWKIWYFNWSFPANCDLCL